MVILASAVLCANSQTNAASPLSSLTNGLASLGAGSNTTATVAIVGSMLLDAQPYFAGKDFSFEVGALKYGSSYGGFFDIQMPVSTNSWQITYGVAMGVISNKIDTATLNVQLGTTVNIPVISPILGPFYMFAESGPGYNLNEHQVIAQYMAGIKYAHALPTNWSVIGGDIIGASYGIGGISDISPKVQEFSLSWAHQF